ncbi:hypothetical protein K2Q16_00475 [Patescibacteria group bacterium]|nr:hypothetical protein [Patescibacteria group bacterium]
MAVINKSPRNRSIDSIPFFPAIAWSIFVMFAAFVFLIANELKQTTLVLEAATFENTSATANTASTPIEQPQ